MEIRRLSASLGAEITDLRLPELSSSGAEEIRDLLHEHLVLFFPEQNLTQDQHVAFGKHFGELESHPNLKNAYLEHDQVFELAASRMGIADEWHSDITFQREPSVMAILNMVKCPAAGGDTMWSNMYRAFDELSEPLRDLCAGLTAVHDAAPHMQPEQTAIHPVVRTHPVTGGKSLFVNEHFTRRIVELSHEESQVLLTYLTNWVSNPRFTVRYHWTEGTIAMWDNRCTQHFVINDFSEERIIQRVTIMGDQPRGAESEPRWQPYARPQQNGATSRFDNPLIHALKKHQARKETSEA